MYALTTRVLEMRGEKITTKLTADQVCTNISIASMRQLQSRWCPRHALRDITEAKPQAQRLLCCIDIDRNPGGLNIARLEQASESRDALAKTLYSNLFDWLVAAINRKIPSYGAPVTACAGCKVADGSLWQTAALRSHKWCQPSIAGVPLW